MKKKIIIIIGLLLIGIGVILCIDRAYEKLDIENAIRIESGIVIGEYIPSLKENNPVQKPTMTKEEILKQLVKESENGFTVGVDEVKINIKNKMVSIEVFTDKTWADQLMYIKAYEEVHSGMQYKRVINNFKELSKHNKRIFEKAGYEVDSEIIVKSGTDSDKGKVLFKFWNGEVK